jgi:Putative phage serine protease XkdF
VYAHGIPDSQDDFMTAAAIRDMAWDFMRKRALSKIDVQHDRKESVVKARRAQTQPAGRRATRFAARSSARASSRAALPSANRRS